MWQLCQTNKKPNNNSRKEQNAKEKKGENRLQENLTLGTKETFYIVFLCTLLFRIS